MNTIADIKKLDELIQSSFNILVVCHVGADPDALSSVIALGDILATHYKKEQVTLAAERIPANLRFIPGYTDVQNTSVIKLLIENAFDLVFFLDFNQWHMCSKENGESIKMELFKQGITSVLIDHHPEEGKNMDVDYYLKLQKSSTAANIFDIFGNHLHAELSEKAANHLLYGLIADTGRFKFAYGESQSEVLTIASHLLKRASLSIEEISNTMDRYPLKMLQVVGLFIKNTEMIDENTSLAFIRDDEIALITPSALGEAATYYANYIGTGVEQAKRCIVIYPHVPEPGTYTLRFRANTPDFPVDKIALSLGGGGHPQSGAARLVAGSIDQAIEKVKEVING